MKKFIIITTVLGLMTPAAWAQSAQKVYTFTLTQDETNLIFNQLTQMPWKDSNTLIQKLSAQAAAQNVPAKVEPPKIEDKPAEVKPEDKKSAP
jgi:hypothetical protein